MKKSIRLFGLAAILACALSACGGVNNDEESIFNYPADYSYIDAAKVAGKSLKVGAILIGDTTEGYSSAHINGINKAVEVLGKAGANVSVSWEYKVLDGDVAATKTKIQSFISGNYDIILTNSYGHQNAFGQIDLEDYPNIDFISMTGDQACTKNLDNYHNAFCSTYQARYLAGYVAGLKLAELDLSKLPANSFDNGKVKLGYVGAYPYAEVVSGYTAFYLGIQAAFPNVVMSVKYVESWWDHDAEKTAAQALISNGAVVVSQHADSTGAPEACQEAFVRGKSVYNVGYNVSMIEAAEDCSLTSATNNWAVYYTHAFYKKLIGEKIERDFCKGIEAGSNGITSINYPCFNQSEEELNAKISQVATALHDGTLKVFDCSKFTVNGEHLSTYTITDTWSSVMGTQCIKTEGGVTYFDESNTSVRSAPYFDIRIDGITELENR